MVDEGGIVRITRDDIDGNIMVLWRTGEGMDDSGIEMLVQQGDRYDKLLKYEQSL